MDEVDKYDGYEIVDYGIYVDNDVDIKRASDGKVKTFNVNQNNLAKAQNQLDEFYKFIRGGTTEAKGTPKATDYIGGLREQYPDLKFKTTAGGSVQVFDRKTKKRLVESYYTNEKGKGKIEAAISPYAPKPVTPTENVNTSKYNK